MPKKKVFLVREMFEWAYGDQPPAPKEPAVWACRDRAEALACRDCLLRTCRHVNPFESGRDSLDDVTSLDAKQFLERIKALGLKPPHKDTWWREWWDRGIHELSDEQLGALWAALDRYSPYAIEETEAEDGTLPAAPARKAYVVQKLAWQYNDNWYDLENDEPVKAFLDRELAELYRMELEEPERQGRRNPRRTAGGEWENATSLTGEQVLARLAEMGIQATEDALWEDDWWDGLRETWPARVVHQVWDLFDRVRFYEVVEIDLDG